MTLRMTPEQYEAYERKRVTQIGRVTPAQKKEMAATWNGNVQPAKFNRAPAGKTAAASQSGFAATPLVLPWPPTGNTAVRHANGAHYIRQEVIDYRNQVALLCLPFKCHFGPYVLHLTLSPPDKRKRDADNAIKTVLDAIKGKLIEDDSMTFMRALHVTIQGQSGHVEVSIEPAKAAA